MSVQFPSSLTKTLLATASLALGLGGLSACDNSTDPLPPHALVKFVNFNPLEQFEFVDFGVDGSWVFVGRPYAGGIDAIRHVPDDDGLTVSARAYGSSTPAATETFTLNIDTTYNVFFVKDTGSNSAGGRFVAMTDTEEPSATAGNAKLQFVHLSPASGAVDVYLVDGTDITTETPVATNLRYLGATGYADFAANTTAAKNVIVTQTGQKTPLVTITHIEKGAGWVYKLILLDSPGGVLPPKWTYIRER